MRAASLTWWRVGALVASGAGQALLLPPVGAWWLAPLVLGLALWALGPLRGWRAGAGGWLLGVASVIALGSWIAPTLVRHGRVSWAVGLAALVGYALVFGAYAGVFALGLGRLRAAAGAWWPLPAAAWWAACEFLNPQLFAHYLGLAFARQPDVLLLTSLTGIAGVSFLMVLVAAVAVAAIERPARARGPALVTLALLLATVVHGRRRGEALAQAQRAAPTRRLALLQDNLDVPARAALARQGSSAIAGALVAQSRRALDADPRIQALVWAETALPGAPLGANAAAVRELVRERRVELWTGGHAWDDQGRSFNAAFRVHGAGVVDPPYRKNILIPFGEYLPLADRFAFLQRLWGRGRNHPGATQPVFHTAAGDVGFLICYEAIKAGYVRRVVAQPLDLLVNLTYDGWFGDSAAPHLHLAAAALQSAQLGVPMVRVSSTGVSAVIDARGVVTASAGLFTQAVVTADVPRLLARTVYGAWGDWFAWACTLAAAACLLGSLPAAARRRRSTGARPPA
jgi:apolipoprotein N-acyltransferase